MRDQDLLHEIQYALLEPPNHGQSFASEVWDRDDVLAALNDALVRVARETRGRTTYLEQSVLPNALSVSLPTDWLATAHLAWRTFPQGVRSPLVPIDSFEADLGAPGWEATGGGSPIGYVDRDTNTLELRLIPTPGVSGILENLYIPVPATATGNGVELGVPDVCLSAVKFGTLAVLLSGPHRLQDPERAAAAEEIVQITLAATEILLRGGG